MALVDDLVRMGVPAYVAQELLANSGGVSNTAQMPLPQTRYALKQMVGGLRNAKIMLIGDSTTTGFYAGGAGGGGYDSVQTLSYPARVAASLRSRYTVYTDNFAGCQPANITYASTADPKLTFGAGWSATGFSVGLFYSNTTVASSITYAPSAVIDTVDVYYLQFSGYDTFDISVDGVQQGANVVTNGATSVLKATRTVPLGQHVVAINKHGTTPNCVIIGISCYNSQSRGIELFNAGSSGATSTNWANVAQVWSPSSVAAGNPWSVFQPDLAVIMLGINDWQGAVAPATYSTNIQTLITALQTAGADVVLMTSVPTASGTTAVATQLGIMQALRNLASQDGLPLVEVYSAYGSYVIAQGNLGYYLPGNTAVHPGTTGYQAIADILVQALGI